MEFSPLAVYPGEISPDLGWKLLASQEGEMVYIPFEGYYESKGGRLQSPRLPLDKKSGESAFYSIRFKAKAAEQCYWWVDLSDENGAQLPDINSAVYPGNALENYEEIIYAEAPAAFMELAFVSKNGISVRDIEIRRVSGVHAAEWCDRLLTELPPYSFEAPCDSFAELQETRKALLNGTPWRVVMLGDSIVNDTYTSNFPALVQRDFPKSRLEFLISVRGSTGCWYYKNQEHFRQYVTDLKPDLVMIGGISNPIHEKECGDPEENMVSVINSCKALGCEVLLMSPPPSYEWRSTPYQTAWDENWNPPGNTLRPMRRDYQRNAVARTGIAYWDLTTVPCNIIAASRKPLNWFKRDGAHNNDRGKQLIGRTLAAYFKTAYLSPK